MGRLGKEMIALYGGTFDPVHNGHIRVVSKILDIGVYDHILIHVSYKPKYKKPKASFKDRFNMADLAFSDMDKNVHVILDKLEYTSNVVKLIRRRFDAGEIHFFTGFDWNIKGFHNAEYLMENVTQIKVNDSDVNKYPALSQHIGAINRGERTVAIRSPISIHSSKIRDLIEEGVRVDGLVPEKVNEYIKKKGLYGYK